MTIDSKKLILKQTARHNTILYKLNYGSFHADHQIQVFVKDCRDEICNFQAESMPAVVLLSNFRILSLQIEPAYLGIPSMTFHRLSLSHWNPVSFSGWSKIDPFVALGPQRSTGCLLSNTFIVILTLGLTTSLPGGFVRHIESLSYFRSFALFLNNQSKPLLERIFRESLVP